MPPARCADVKNRRVRPLAFRLEHITLYLQPVGCDPPHGFDGCDRVQPVGEPGLQRFHPAVFAVLDGRDFRRSCKILSDQGTVATITRFSPPAGVKSPAARRSGPLYNYRILAFACLRLDTG